MYLKMSDEEYFALPDLNQSKIKDYISLTPAAFDHKQKEERSQTEAMLFGSIVHCMVLEPESYHERYACFVFDDTKLDPEKEYKNIKATKIYKEQYAEFLDRSGDKIVIDQDLASRAGLASMSLKKEVEAFQNVGTPDVQTEMAVVAKLLGVPSKAKLDYVRMDSNLIIDIKTTSDPLDDASLHRHVYKWHFPIQSAFYLDLMKEETGQDWTMIFAMVNSKLPYDVRCMAVSDELTPDFLDIGREKIVEGIDLHRLYETDRPKFFETTTFLPEKVPYWY